MTNRLPIPGGDSGDWGDILNSFLEVSLYNNTNNTSDPNNGSLNPNTVGTSQVQNNAITNAQLDSPTQTTLASVASKYVRPVGGIPSSDLAGNIPVSALSTTGTANSSTYLTGAGTWSTPAAGVTLDSTATDIQPLGTRSAGTSSKAAKADHVHTMPSASQVGALTSTDDLSAIASTNATAADVSMNSNKLTDLSNGTAATDAAAYGQIPSAGTTTGTYAAGNDSRFASALQANNNLSDLSSATTARTNLGLGTAATISSSAGGDLSGTLPSPTVAKIQGTTISSPSGGATSYLNAIGTWTTPIGSSNASSIDGVDVTGTPSANQVLTASSSTAASWTTQAAGASNATTSTPGLVELAGDLSGTATAPTVTSTHLTSALPLAQGGTGSTTQNFVDLSSSQTIAGTKTFSSPIAGSITGNAATATTATSAGSATTATNSTTAATATATNALNSATTTVVVNGATAPTSGQVLTASSSTAASWTTPSASTSGAQALVPTAVKTSAYTASPGDFVPVDASGGSVTITLPTAPADKTRIEIKMVNTASPNIVTFNTGGSDVLNKAGGVTTGSLTLLSQAVMLQYTASTAIWYVQSDDLPLSQLDARYASLGANSNITSLSGLTTALTVAQGGTGSTTQNFVDLTSAQTVAGSKTFTSLFQVGNNVQPTTTNSYTLGNSSSYWNAVFATSHYLNSTAYFSGSTAGIIATAGKLVTAASTSSSASLNIALGTAPTTPTSGDIWFDGSHLQFNNGTSTYQLDQQGALNWNVVSASATASINTGYIINSSSQVIITLPTTAATGTVIEVAGYGTGGWKVAQPAGANVIFGSTQTTIGTGGSLTSTNAHDTVRMVCAVANSGWLVVSSVGNITVT